MTTRLKIKLTVLLTTVAFAAAVPATDAFATGSWKSMVHRVHSCRASAHYVLGNNWKTTDHGTLVHCARLHHIDYGLNWG